MDLPLHVAQNALDPLAKLSPSATQLEQTVVTSPTTITNNSNNNNKRQTARGDASYPRKRANTACQVCRARKTKCDNRKPRCSFCERVGARCVSSSSTDLSTFDPASLAILERIDQLEGKLQARSQSDANDQRDDARSSTHSTPCRRDSALRTNGPSKGNVAIINVEKILSWPVFHHRFDNHLNLKPLLEGSLSAPNRLSMQYDRATALGELEIESCSRLLEVFFKHVHIKNPVLDEKLVRQWARDVCFNGIAWNAQSCLVLLVAALGAVSLPFDAYHEDDPISGGRSVESVRAESWFNASQRRIGALLTKGDVLSAQCFFFSGVYLMQTMRPFQAWALFVQALACCQKFDFYAGAFGAPDVQEVVGSETPWRSEESMYWTCFKSELELRLQLAVPGIGAAGDLSYPSFLPSPPPGSVKDQERSWYFYLAEIALRRLGNQILTHVVQYAVDDRFDNLEEISAWMSSFESHAQEWSRLLPPEMDLQTSQRDDDILRFVLRGHLLDSYEIMYWPFLVEAINNTSRDIAYQILVRKGLRVCVERIWKNEGGFYHHHHGTWLMLRSCTRSALILVAAKMCAHLDELLPPDWEEAVRKVIALLGFWQEESGDARDRRYILENLMANF